MDVHVMANVPLRMVNTNVSVSTAGPDSIAPSHSKRIATIMLTMITVSSFFILSFLELCYCRLFPCCCVYDNYTIYHIIYIRVYIICLFSSLYTVFYSYLLTSIFFFFFYLARYTCIFPSFTYALLKSIRKILGIVSVSRERAYFIIDMLMDT